MGKIGQFDTDLDALFTRVNSHKNFGSFDINKWIFSKLFITISFSSFASFILN